VSEAGVHAILYAFFDQAVRLDRDAMRRQTELCTASGVAGVAVLGLATEVLKLTLREKMTLLEWTAEDLAGRLPLGVTLSGSSLAEQVELLRAAERSGASWLILQPPMVGAYAPAEYISFFGRVADATSLPVAIQNAPAYMGRGLSASEIDDLAAHHGNIRLLKGEMAAVEIERVIAHTEGRIRVFNGRGGLELIDNLRAGVDGFVLAPDVADHAAIAMRLYRAGAHAEARERYATILPAITFVMQSLEILTCYGKRLFAARAGLEVHDRAPAHRPTAFGLDLVDRYAADLGPFPAAASAPSRA
jgi:2-keto-3-deoxy-L-arabinonate dehydratase